MAVFTCEKCGCMIGREGYLAHDLLHWEARAILEAEMESMKKENGD